MARQLGSPREAWGRTQINVIIVRALGTGHRVGQRAYTDRRVRKLPSQQTFEKFLLSLVRGEAQVHVQVLTVQTIKTFSTLSVLRRRKVSIDESVVKTSPSYPLKPVRLPHSVATAVVVRIRSTAIAIPRAVVSVH